MMRFGYTIAAVLLITRPVVAGDLKFQIECSTQSRVPGEPIWIHLSLTNEGPGEIALGGCPDCRCSFEVARDGGPFRPEAGGKRYGGYSLGPPRRMGIGTTYDWEEVITAATLRTPVRPLFDRTGKYRLRARLDTGGVSNIVEFLVREPAPDEADAAACLMDLRVVANLLKLTTKQRSRLEKVASSLKPSSLHDAIAMIVAANYWPDHFENFEWRSPDLPDRAFSALSWLSAVDTDPELTARALHNQFQIREPTPGLDPFFQNTLVWINIRARYEHARAGTQSDYLIDQLDREIAPRILVHLYGMPDDPTALFSALFYNSR